MPLDDVVEIEEPRLATSWWHLDAERWPAIEHPAGGDPLDHPPLPLHTLYAKWTSVFRELLAGAEVLLAETERHREQLLKQIQELGEALAEAERVDAEREQP